MSANPQQTNPLQAAGGIIGALVGFSMSRYAGASVWIPGIVTVLLMLLFTKTPLRPKYFQGAIAVTGGHIAWFVVGALFAGQFGAVAADILVLTGLVVWLGLAPGLVPAVVLGAAQLISLAINVLALTSFPFGHESHRALTVHCTWRILAVACLIVGYLNMQRAQAAEDQAAEDLAAEALADQTQADDEQEAELTADDLVSDEGSR